MRTAVTTERPHDIARPALGMHPNQRQSIRLFLRAEHQMWLRRHTTFEGVHFKIPRFGRQSRGYQWLHGSKIGSLPPSRVTPMASENKKRGPKPPLCFSHSNAQRQVKPNVAKNASKSPVVAAPSPSRSAGQSFVSVNSHELSSTFAIGSKLLAES